MLCDGGNNGQQQDSMEAQAIEWERTVSSGGRRAAAVAAGAVMVNIDWQWQLQCRDSTSDKDSGNGVAAGGKR